MKPRNINNSLPLQPLVPDQENKNKKNEEKSVNPVKNHNGVWFKLY
ncbi:Uncharacterised protein [Escherichia coli]|nr:Uncharacterised protein [Escherichia coli]